MTETNEGAKVETPQAAWDLIREQTATLNKNFSEAVKGYDKKEQWLLYCRFVNALFARCYNPVIGFSFNEIAEQNKEIDALKPKEQPHD